MQAPKSLHVVAYVSHGIIESLHVQEIPYCKESLGWMSVGAYGSSRSNLGPGWPVYEHSEP